jgi:apoptosis-inducing factor 3
MGANGRRDFTRGVAFSELPDGNPVTGNVGEEEAILVRRGENLFAVAAHCTHYHGALADGLVVGDTVRCPLHHACFDLRTGKALRAPALDPITCWRVERIGETAFVREKLPSPAVPRIDSSGRLDCLRRILCAKKGMRAR